MKSLVARQMFAQQKRLKEPRGVRQMPLRRARIRHGLQTVILYRQRRATPQRSLPDAAVFPRQAQVPRRRYRTSNSSGCGNTFHGFSEMAIVSSRRFKSRCPMEPEAANYETELWTLNCYTLKKSRTFRALRQKRYIEYLT